MSDRVELAPCPFCGNLFERWIQQAYLEGFMMGRGKKLTPDGRAVLEARPHPRGERE